MRSVYTDSSGLLFLGGEPQKGCRTSKYGCCWDAYTPRGDIYGRVGCPGKLKIWLNMLKMQSQAALTVQVETFAKKTQCLWKRAVLVKIGLGVIDFNQILIWKSCTLCEKISYIMVFHTAQPKLLRKFLGYRLKLQSGSLKVDSYYFIIISPSLFLFFDSFK